jgi:LmbE family N-acetylglucosaminyl deacetylase
MKAICMVAHPDDCIIFAIGYILAHPELDWSICYLTHSAEGNRGQEISQFWQQRNIATDFLGFEDVSTDMLFGNISFDQTKAHTAIFNKIFHGDLILTHNATGEYGHVHHKFVHSVCRYHPNVVTFADSPGFAYAVPEDYYSLDELPLHRDGIRSLVKVGRQINYYDRI